MYQQWREIDYTDEDYFDLYKLYLEKKHIKDRKNKLNILIKNSTKPNEIFNKFKK